jgi:signal transduction histidine kinase
MRKKIVIGLIIFSSFFFAGGLYIIITIETSTEKLDNLITLHQVEILREHLLLNIRKVQSDLNLKNTRYARSMDTVIENVGRMDHSTEICFKCHHAPHVLQQLMNLQNDIEHYKSTLSTVLTMRANVRRLKAQEDKAYNAGEKLMTKVNSMIDVARLNLENKTQSSLKEISDTKFFLYILITIVPLLAAGAGYIFIRGFTKPVNMLQDATRRLKSGNLDYRIKGLKDEFGEVASSFNEMAASLRNQLITMQRADQMKVVGEWATGLAHEIKNPLAGIKVSVEVLADELNVSDEDREVILKVVDEIKRIELLLKSLLNYAKPSEPQFMTVDMNDLIDKTIDFSMKHPKLLSGESPSISVLRDFDKNLPATMVDPMHMQQVFMNVVLNAIEAMPHGGTLTVRTSYDSVDNYIKIHIADTGTGVDGKVLDKIFQPFFTTKIKGTGFGLAITKQLVELHGGSISVRNLNDRGAEFRVRIPVKEEGKENLL